MFCTCIDQGTVGIVQSCGKYRRHANPGFTCLWPCYFESLAGTVSMRVQQIDVVCETKTSDNVFVNVVVSVQYKILPERIYESFYSLTDSQAQIRSYVFDVVRSSVPKMKLDDVFMLKENLANDVKNELIKIMHNFGYEILQALVTDIVPDEKVKRAMNEINAAQRNRMAAQDKAEAEKIMIVKAAEADAEAKYLAGVGIARQRQAIVSGIQESMSAFNQKFNTLNPQTVMDMIIVTQYFDTLKDIGSHSKSNTIFIPSDTGDVGKIASQMRNGLLQAQTMTRD